MRRPAALLAFLLLVPSFRPCRAADGPPKETGTFRAPDLVELVTLDPSIRLDVRYARADNFLKRPVYTEERAFLQRPAAEALVRVTQALREKGYGLMVFDGYRPWRVTKLFWDMTPPEGKIFVADPAKGSRHNRGCAVDLTLFDLATGRASDMGGAYDEMSPRSYVTWDKGTKEVAARRELLRTTMEANGFSVYPWEWWHYDYKEWRDYAIQDIPFAEIGTSPRPATRAPDLATAHVVDLTHPFDEKTLYWPSSPSAFELHRLSFGKTPAGFFYSANTISTPEHGGTHVDAPIHFAEGGLPLDQLPPERLIGEAVVIDVTKEAGADPDYRLTPADVTRWEARYGRVPSGAIVLLRTGWSARWPDRMRYFGDDVPGRTTDLHFPSYGREAAELLVKERGVAALGVDTASIDHGPSTEFPVHQVAAARNVPGLENLARLDELPARGAWVVGLPMKIAGGSGGPLRIVALLGK